MYSIIRYDSIPSHGPIENNYSKVIGVHPRRFHRRVTRCAKTFAAGNSLVNTTVLREKTRAITTRAQAFVAAESAANVIYLGL